MDRGHGHRTVLSVTVAVGGVALLAYVGGLSAQIPSPTATATKPATPAPSASTATPWVQASPPATTSPAKPSPRPEKAPSPTVTPATSPSKEEVAKAMARKREEELAKQAAASPATTEKPLPPRLMRPRLSPEENEAYERNLALWLALPSDEKKEIRVLAAARVQEETEKAYEASGLTLNEDQREVFALRYRQERRRLERDLQDKARAERERRLPEIMDRLKREFAGRDVAKPKPAPTPAPSPSPVPTATPTPTIKS